MVEPVFERINAAKTMPMLESNYMENHPLKQKASLKVMYPPD